MRYNILKIHSTKCERIIYEILKELKIPFKHRWIISGREIDFLILDKYCLEINGHAQDTEKNNLLTQLGYVPIHYHNEEIKNNRELIKHKLKCLQD